MVRTLICRREVHTNDLSNSTDLHAGNTWLLSRASVLLAHVTLDSVVARPQDIGHQVLARRDETQVETPLSAVARLIYGHFGVELEDAISDGTRLVGAPRSKTDQQSVVLERVAALNCWMRVLASAVATLNQH